MERYIYLATHAYMCSYVNSPALSGCNVTQISNNLGNRNENVDGFHLPAFVLSHPL